MNNSDEIGFAKPAVRKKVLSRTERKLRGFYAAFDPRAWFHLFRILNYYNHTHVIPRRTLTCGAGAAISPTASFANGHNITLGADAHIGAHSCLWAGPMHGKITSGDNLLLGPNVMITASNYDARAGRPVTRQPLNEQSVLIGHDVWIGANAVLLSGVQVGDGAIVGAGAVVTRNVEKNSIVAGNPARKIGDRQLVVGKRTAA